MNQITNDTLDNIQLVSVNHLSEGWNDVTLTAWMEWQWEQRDVGR